MFFTYLIASLVTAFPQRMNPTQSLGQVGLCVQLMPLNLENSQKASEILRTLCSDKRVQALMKQNILSVLNVIEMEPNTPRAQGKGDMPQRGVTSGRKGKGATKYIKINLRDPDNKFPGTKDGWREFSGQGKSRNIIHTWLHELTHSIIPNSASHFPNFRQKLEEIKKEYYRK